MRELLAQHTAERGQGFEAGAVERIWALTCGQPWLVNALACEACFRAEHGPDRSRAIGVDAIDEARLVETQLGQHRAMHSTGNHGMLGSPGSLITLDSGVPVGARLVAMIG